MQKKNGIFQTSSDVIDKSTRLGRERSEGSKQTSRHVTEESGILRGCDCGFRERKIVSKYREVCYVMIHPYIDIPFSSFVLRS